jgi:hypothetical protein
MRDLLLLPGRQKGRRSVARRRGVDTRAIAAFYATVQHGMSIRPATAHRARPLLAVADCAMAAWDRLVTQRRNRRLAGLVGGAA